MYAIWQSSQPTPNTLRVYLNLFRIFSILIQFYIPQTVNFTPQHRNLSCKLSNNYFSSYPHSQCLPDLIQNFSHFISFYTSNYTFPTCTLKSSHLAKHFFSICQHCILQLYLVQNLFLSPLKFIQNFSYFIRLFYTQLYLTTSIYNLSRFRSERS